MGLNVNSCCFQLWPENRFYIWPTHRIMNIRPENQAYLWPLPAAVPCTGSQNLSARIYVIYAFCDTMTGTKGIIIDPWCPTFVDRCTPGALLRALRFAQLRRCCDKITKDNLRILRESTACGKYEGRMLRLAAAGSSADGCPPGGRCLEKDLRLFCQPEFPVYPKGSPVKGEA